MVLGESLRGDFDGFVLPILRNRKCFRIDGKPHTHLPILLRELVAPHVLQLAEDPRNTRQCSLIWDRMFKITAAVYGRNAQRDVPIFISHVWRSLSHLISRSMSSSRQQQATDAAPQTPQHIRTEQLISLYSDDEMSQIIRPLHGTAVLESNPVLARRAFVYILTLCDPNLHKRLENFRRCLKWMDTDHWYDIDGTGEIANAEAYTVMTVTIARYVNRVARGYALNPQEAYFTDAWR